MSDVNMATLERDRDIVGLLAALQGADAETREKIADALGRVGDKRAVAALTALLADPHSVDPRDLYRGDRAFEEMGDESPIYPVRDAARKALAQIAGRAEDSPAAPLVVGNLVRQWRRLFLGKFEDVSYENCIWRLLELGPEGAYLWLEEGMYWDWNSDTKKGVHRKAGFTIKMKNSLDYDTAFPGSEPFQEFLDTYKKVD